MFKMTEMREMVPETVTKRHRTNVDIRRQDAAWLIDVFGCLHVLNQHSSISEWN